MSNAALLLFIAMILFTTKAFSVLVRRFHLPQVVGALIAGLLLGPSVINLIEPNEILSNIAGIGVILLLFSAGLETDFRELRSNYKSSLLISLCGVALSLGGGFLVAFLFGNPTFESFFIGVVIASMSTSITVEALQEMGKLKSKSGSSIMGASLFDDVIVIILLAVVMGAGEGGFGIGSIAAILLRIIVFFVAATFAGMLIKRLFSYLFNRYGQLKSLPIFGIAYCFLMAYLAEQFGLADITGAYIAGITFCNTRCGDFLDKRVHSLSYMFFTPMFLANIGISASFAGMDARLFVFSLALAAAALVTKFMGCGLAARLCRFSTAESLQIGTGMMARGEVTFIVAAKGIMAGYISYTLFPSIIMLVLVTVLVTPLLMKAAFSK